MNRKKFLKKCARLSSMGVLLPILGSSCKTIFYIPHTVQNNGISVNKADMEEQSFVVIQPSRFPAPIYLTRLEDNQYSALLLQCTHRACEVRPAGDELQCPCHGSVFSKTGEVLESPAERPLRSFEVVDLGETLLIK